LKSCRRNSQQRSRHAPGRGGADLALAGGERESHWPRRQRPFWSGDRSSGRHAVAVHRAVELAVIRMMRLRRVHSGDELAGSPRTLTRHENMSNSDQNPVLWPATTTPRRPPRAMRRCSGFTRGAMLSQKRVELVEVGAHASGVGGAPPRADKAIPSRQQRGRRHMTAPRPDR